MPKTAENCGGRIQEIVCEDMISALPEDLLVTILKNVPLKDAVATMILSKRWLFVWTMLPILEYQDNNDDESNKSVWWFLDKSLQLNNAPVLQRFFQSLVSWVVSWVVSDRRNGKLIVSWSTIKFSRLKRCMIYPCDSDWMDSLLRFLENTPKLKLLIVDYYGSTRQPPTASASWSESSYEPKCLSSSLEKFELKDYTGRKEEQELVEYIVTTSKCLKTATISFRSLPDLNLEDKDTMMEKLKAIPRVSKTSQLLFKS